MDDVAFYITSWDPEGTRTRSLRNELRRQGVRSSNIEVLSDRRSRAISLNNAIKTCGSPYVGFCEDDVMPARNAVVTLTRLLDAYENVGLAIAPVTQSAGAKIGRPTPSLPERSRDKASLVDQSGMMWTLNFVLYRKSTDVLFDEDYFGNQILDWCFGLDLERRGFLSVADNRTAVAHRLTNYTLKGLCYHACVARNRQIFMLKWKDRDHWKSVANHNLTSKPLIPTIEELTHANETWLMDYINKYDRRAIVDCYYKPRFGDPARIARHVKSWEKRLNAAPHVISAR